MKVRTENTVTMGANNILSGSSTGGTIISIPSGATWIGSISISATGDGTAGISTDGTVFPPDTVLATVTVTTLINAANIVIPEVVIHNPNITAFDVITNISGASGTITMHGILV